MSPHKRPSEHWFHRWKRPWRKPWRVELPQGAALLRRGLARGPQVPYPAWSFPEGLELVHDPTPGRWVEESVVRYPWATVGMLLPEGFEAYARILHPAYRRVTRYEHRPIRWSEVAEMTGRSVHPHVQFERLGNLGDDMNKQPEWGDRPAEGELPEEVAAPLQRILGGFTTTAERCWFCVWYGWGDSFALEGYDEEAYRHVKIPGREYLLLRGPLELVSKVGANGGNDPSIWWPDDHSWCVATEIDLDSTYVGGSSECIARLMEEPALEVLPAALEDRIDLSADTINI
jgi:hypothetical protein